jgi:hypothetical protein
VSAINQGIDMRIIVTLAAAAGLAALSACGGAEEQNAVENLDTDMMVTDNLDMPADNMMDMNTGTDMNNMADDSGNMMDNDAGNAADNATGNTTY